MAVTLKEVAARAGVSRSAVSRSFTKGASVSERTRAKVMKAARELGYSPSALASALSTGRSKLIGLVSNNFHNPVFLEVFDQFTRGLQQAELRPLLVNLSQETNPQNTLSMLRQYSVDGVIVASPSLPPGFASAFRQAGMPVVHAFGRYSTHPEVPMVGIDNIACGWLAAKTLRARGYRRIGFLGGPENASATQDRFTGFLQGASGASDLEITHCFASAYSFDAGRVTMSKELLAGPSEAYFCAEDVLAIGALSAAQSAGLTVPDDLGLLGLDDMEMARWENINLTTIHQPLPDIVAGAIEVITALLEAPERAPEQRLFPCQIIERGTLRPLPETIAT
ncbi:MAG: LacI family transcriptional regulator [Mangrovicoccus sp.]|nr:LacI family transcriptional regulator [Mangrovicoccus sp.]